MGVAGYILSLIETIVGFKKIKCVTVYPTVSLPNLPTLSWISPLKLVT